MTHAHPAIGSILLALLWCGATPALAETPDAPQPCRIERDGRGEHNMALDGKFETVTSFDLDEHGRVRRSVCTEVFGGQIQIREKSYTHDALGLVTREVVRRTVFAGDTASGVSHDEFRHVEEFDSCSARTFTYDTAGNRLTEDIDDGCSGTAEWRMRWTYDEQGRVIHLAENIRITTGKVGLQRRYTYNAHGQLELDEVDNAGDGTYPLQIRHEYDAVGRLTRKIRDWTDPGMVDETEEFAYDAYGRLLSRTVYHPPGTEFTSTVYRYDAAGVLQAEDERVGANHIITAHTEYRYDCR